MAVERKQQLLNLGPGDWFATPNAFDIKRESATASRSNQGVNATRVQLERQFGVYAPLCHSRFADDAHLGHILGCETPNRCLGEKEVAFDFGSNLEIAHTKPGGWIFAF
jgi:hypothetical protein